MSVLRKLRESKKMSLRDLAKATGIDYSTIAKIERGDRGFNEQNLSIFSDYFGVPTDYLLGRTETIKTKIIEKEVFTSPYKDTKEFRDIIGMMDRMTRDELIMFKGMGIAIMGNSDISKDKRSIV